MNTRHWEQDNLPKMGEDQQDKYEVAEIVELDWELARTALTKLRSQRPKHPQPYDGVSNPREREEKWPVQPTDESIYFNYLGENHYE